MAASRMVVIGYEQAELLDIACVTTALDGANRMGLNRPYDTVVATPGGHAIACSSGLALRGNSPLNGWSVRSTR